MKLIVARGFTFLAILFLVQACASQSEVSSTRSTSQPEGTVPGETVPGPQLAPGTGTSPNASMRW